MHRPQLASISADSARGSLDSGAQETSHDWPASEPSRSEVPSAQDSLSGGPPTPPAHSSFKTPANMASSSGTEQSDSTAFDDSSSSGMRPSEQSTLWSSTSTSSSYSSSSATISEPSPPVSRPTSSSGSANQGSGDDWLGAKKPEKHPESIVEASARPQTTDTPLSTVTPPSTEASTPSRGRNRPANDQDDTSDESRDTEDEDEQPQHQKSSPSQTESDGTLTRHKAGVNAAALTTDLLSNEAGSESDFLVGSLATPSVQEEPDALSTELSSISGFVINARSSAGVSSSRSWHLSDPSAMPTSSSSHEEGGGGMSSGAIGGTVVGVAAAVGLLAALVFVLRRCLRADSDRTERPTSSFFAPSQSGIGDRPASPRHLSVDYRHSSSGHSGQGDPFQSIESHRAMSSDHQEDLYQPNSAGFGTGPTNMVAQPSPATMVHQLPSIFVSRPPPAPPANALQTRNHFDFQPQPQTASPLPGQMMQQQPEPQQRKQVTFRMKPSYQSTMSTGSQYSQMTMPPGRSSARGSSARPASLVAGRARMPSVSESPQLDADQRDSEEHQDVDWSMAMRSPEDNSIIRFQ